MIPTSTYIDNTNYKKSLLYYKLYRSLLVFFFLTDPFFIRLTPSFRRQCWCSVFHCAGSARSRDPQILSPSVVNLSSNRVCGIRFPCAYRAPLESDVWLGGEGGGGIRGKCAQYNCIKTCRKIVK